MKLPQIFKMSYGHAGFPKKASKNSVDSCSDSIATASTAPESSDTPTLKESQKTPQIPDIRKESRWFNHWDVHGLGMLSKVEATAAIQETFSSLDTEKLSCIIGELWSEFDREGTGSIGREAMLRKQIGLVDASLRAYQLASLAPSSQRKHVISL